LKAPLLVVYDAWAGLKAGLHPVPTSVFHSAVSWTLLVADAATLPATAINTNIAKSRKDFPSNKIGFLIHFNLLWKFLITTCVCILQCQ
jgi:hypothetical protein